MKDIVQMEKNNHYEWRDRGFNEKNGVIMDNVVTECEKENVLHAPSMKWQIGHQS